MAALGLIGGRGGPVPQGRERGSEAKRHVVDMLYEMKVKVECSDIDVSWYGIGT